MGIDYVIPHPCGNREELGETGLRRWTFLYMIHKYLQEHPELSKKGLEEREWNMPTIRGLKTEQQSFKYADIKDVGERIQSRIALCKDCPANLDPKADEFGCVGRINYPIQACFEEFVGERIQLAFDRRGEAEWPTLLNLILRRDSPFDGAPIARLRNTVVGESSRLLERSEPVRFERAGDGISTDHVLHALLGMASDKSEKVSYSREIPRELTSIYLDFLAGLLYGSLAETRVLELSRTCPSYLQFRWLHRALRIAYRLGVPLYLH